MNEIQSIVTQFIKKALPESELQKADFQLQALLAKPIEELGLDSLESMELIMEIEDHFGIMLDEELVLACRGIGDLADLVSTSVNGRQ